MESFESEFARKVALSESIEDNYQAVETQLTKKYYDTEDIKHYNQYKVIKTVGSGSYSKVKLMENTETGEFVCFKIINEFILERKKKSFTRDEEGNILVTTMLDDVKNEIKALKIMNHPNITKMHEIIVDKDNRKNYLVIDYALHGCLMTYDDSKDKFVVNPAVTNNDNVIPEANIKRILHSLAKALSYIHRKNIVHRDLKPDNILITKDQDAMLSDFSICSIIEGEDYFRKTEGNNYFFAPELCQGKSSFRAKPVDIWAYGVCAYIMIYNTFPIIPQNKLNLIMLFDMIRAGEVEYPMSKNKASKELIELVKRCLTKDPDVRITASELENHPYFKEEAKPTEPANEIKVTKSKTNSTKPINPTVTKQVKPIANQGAITGKSNITNVSKKIK